MRIISGKWKSRRLYSVKGGNTRPTSDRVKEAVFNIIMDKVDSSIVLDIFAGTGNFGFEALSRGSSKAVFIEKDIRAAKVIEKNAQMLQCKDKVYIMRKDVFRAIDDLQGSGYKFDLVFIDPPYNLGIEVEVITAVFDKDIISRQGMVIVEHSHRDKMPDNIGKLTRISTRKYGNTSISFFMRGDLQ